MAHLDRLEDYQETTLRMLRSALSKAGYDEDSDDDVFPNVLTTVDDIEDLEKRLREKTYRCKLVSLFCIYIIIVFCYILIGNSILMRAPKARATI